MQRVQKTGGSNATEIVYFRGHPVALLNPSSGAWTDLIWAGKNLLAEVPGSQTGSPVYRLLDYEGTLAATTTSSGAVIATNLFTPYGQPMIPGTGDAYSYAGLFQDTEYAGDAAWYRNYTTQQARWLRPDPYNGSYDLYNPQSFNRYMYVNGNPLGSVDPSGLTVGVTGGVGGSICSVANWTDSFSYGGLPYSFNPCSPVSSIISITAESILGQSLVTQFGSTVVVPFFGTVNTLDFIAPIITSAFTIACSVDSNTTACGPPGITSLIPGNWGKATGDITSVVGAFACALGGPSNPVCIGYGVYTAVNDILGLFGVFDKPQFTGSLLPRPTDLGGLGTSPIGIPNHNLDIQGIEGATSHVSIPSPGVSPP